MLSLLWNIAIIISSLFYVGQNMRMETSHDQFWHAFNAYKLYSLNSIHSITCALLTWLIDMLARRSNRSSQPCLTKSRLTAAMVRFEYI